MNKEQKQQKKVKIYTDEIDNIEESLNSFGSKTDNYNEYKSNQAQFSSSELSDSDTLSIDQQFQTAPKSPKLQKKFSRRKSKGKILFLHYNNDSQISNIEQRINLWLDNQQIEMVMPDPENDYYAKIKQNLIYNFKSMKVIGDNELNGDESSEEQEDFDFSDSENTQQEQESNNNNDNNNNDNDNVVKRLKSKSNNSKFGENNGKRQSIGKYCKMKTCTDLDQQNKDRFFQLQHPKSLLPSLQQRRSMKRMSIITFQQQQ